MTAAGPLVDRSDVPTPAPSLRGRLRAGVFHHGRLLLNGWRAVREVGAALAATPEERVLDLGCGCGWFSRAVPGAYLGIDLDPDYVAFAERRFGTARHAFAVQDLADLDGREQFDKAIMASCLHHLSDAQASAILARLARMVRRRLVVLDLDPERAGGIRGMLLARDRGEHIRPGAAQRALLEPHFAVTRDHRFAIPTVAHTLFTCEPRG